MKEYNDSSQKNRDDILSSLIRKSRFARGLGELDDTAFVLTLATWEDTLKAIPDGELERAYDWATADDDGKKPFGAVSVLRAWNSRQRKRGQERQAAIGVEGCCSRDGFITVDATGSPNIPKDYRGHTYTKPCPTHRPFGIPRHPDPDYVAAPRIGHREGIRQAEIFRELNPSHKPEGAERIGLGGLAKIGDFAKKIMQKISGETPLFPPDLGN